MRLKFIFSGNLGDNINYYCVNKIFFYNMSGEKIPITSSNIISETYVSRHSTSDWDTFFSIGGGWGGYNSTLSNRAEMVLSIPVDKILKIELLSYTNAGGAKYVKFQQLNTDDSVIVETSIEYSTTCELKTIFPEFLTHKKTSLETIAKLGDNISCRYTSPAENKIGYFSNLCSYSSDVIPVTGAVIPDGNFNWIFVGYDTFGRKKFIADRNIQHSLPWDTINTEGFSQGKPLNISDYPCNISTIYYVSESGNDTTGDGSKLKPFKTVYAAVNKCVGGDTIYISAGTYDVTYSGGSYGGGGLYDYGKSINFIGEKNKTIFLCDGAKHSLRDHHAILTKGTDTSIFNIIFRSNCSGRSTNYTVSIFGGDSFLSVNAKVYNCVFDYMYYNNSQCSMIYDNSSASNVVIKNSIFICNDYFLSSYTGASCVKLINCACKKTFADGTRTTCLDNATFDSNYNITSSGSVNTGTGYNRDGTKANIGVYGGLCSWAETLKLIYSDKLKFYIRLLTGGTSSSDKDNEWDKIIVESNLGGLITAGDNNVWNWSSLYSWTSSTASGASTTKITRGRDSASTSVSKAMTSVDGSWGFRPMLIVETLFSPKFLLLDGESIKTYKNNTIATIGTAPATRLMFDDDGLEAFDIRLLQNTMNRNIKILVNNTQSTDLKLGVKHKAKVIKSKTDINLEYINSIDCVNVTSAGNSKIFASFDKGLTYNYFDGTNWILVDLSQDLTGKGNYSTDVRNITSSQWEVLRKKSKTLRFAYAISGTDTVGELACQFDIRGKTFQGIVGTDYDVEYVDESLIRVYFYKNGTYKINVPIGG